jgi:AcrR family transcriptional regulator
MPGGHGDGIKYSGSASDFGSTMGLREVYVPGYGGLRMGGKKGAAIDAKGARTPWGYAAELREKKMRPGRGNAPEDSQRSQRERLMGAMVALSAEQGYEATKIGELVKVAGVSRAAFYDHFKDKEELLLAAVEALVEPTIALIERAEDAGTGEARVRQALEAFLRLAASQPAASKMCFIEVYAAGPAGEALVERITDAFVNFGLEQLNQIPGRKGTPPQMVRAMLGGLQKVIHKRLYSDKAGELPKLAEDVATWGLSYPPPPGPLDPPKRRGRRAKSFTERQAVGHPPERVLRALAALVAEKGYKATTVADVVERAGTSQRVFYGHFESKEEAFLSALDSGSAQMLGLVLPAFRRARSWEESVRAAYEAMFSFGIEEPEYTQLGAVEMYTVGRRALQTRDSVMEGLEALLIPGYEINSDVPPIAAEAIGGAIYALIHDQVKKKGPESLPALAPMATYMTLTPFLGAKEAYERATEEWEKW